MWLDSNENQSCKTVLERLKDIRIKPNQGIHRLSITIHNFFSKRTSNTSLPGFSVSNQESLSTSSEEIHNLEARSKISILTKARRSSVMFSNYFHYSWLTASTVTVMLVTTLCWWCYDGDRYNLLITKSLCLRLFSFLNRSPTSLTCHQHILSPSLTSMLPHQFENLFQFNLWNHFHIHSEICFQVGKWCK